AAVRPFERAEWSGWGYSSGTSFDSGANDPTPARIWDADTGREVGSLPLSKLGPVRGSFRPVDGAFSPDGRRVLLRDRPKVYLWEPGADRVTATLEDVAPIVAAAFSPDGRRVATAAGNSVLIWDATTGQVLLRLHGHTRPVIAVAFSPNDRL